MSKWAVNVLDSSSKWKKMGKFWIFFLHNHTTDLSDLKYHLDQNFEEDLMVFFIFLEKNYLKNWKLTLLYSISLKGISKNGNFLHYRLPEIKI